MPIFDLTRALEPKAEWLYQRLQELDPHVSPDFASLGAVSWMRALAMLCNSAEFTDTRLTQHYANTQRRTPVQHASDTQTFVTAFMAFQNLSTLSAMQEVAKPSDVIRSAIVAWYYGIYHAAGAMIAAQDGSVQETHSSRAQSWDRQIAQNGLIPPPFAYRFSTLVRVTYEQEYAVLRGDNDFTLPNLPVTVEEAHGAHLSYLKGTADYERKLAEDRLKTGPELKKIGATSFRTKAAREVRDRRLRGKATCFLNAAFRFRGKANYRDAIFLGYGTEYQNQISQLIEDLRASLTAFLRAASYFCARRVERGTWNEFIADIEANSSLSLRVDVLRV